MTPPPTILSDRAEQANLQSGHNEALVVATRALRASLEPLLQPRTRSAWIVEHLRLRSAAGLRPHVFAGTGLTATTFEELRQVTGQVNLAWMR